MEEKQFVFKWNIEFLNLESYGNYVVETIDDSNFSSAAKNKIGAEIVNIVWVQWIRTIRCDQLKLAHLIKYSLLENNLISKGYEFMVNEEIDSNNALQYFTYLNEIVYLLAGHLYYMIRLNFQNKRKQQIPKYLQVKLNNNDIELSQDISAFFKSLNHLVSKLSAIDINNCPETFANIIDMIDKYAGGVTLFNRYKKKGNGCVLFYDYHGVNPSNNYCGILAVSGYTDCCDMKIITYIEPNRTKCIEFIKLLKSYAKTINAKLVTTNSAVAKFGLKRQRTIPDYNIVEIDSIKTVMEKGGDLKNDYCCCERKLFTYADYYYQETDTMNVKFYPCMKCELGIVHEWERGKVFNLVSGLPN